MLSALGSEAGSVSDHVCYMSCDQLSPSGRSAVAVESHYLQRIRGLSSGAENRIAAKMAALTPAQRRHAKHIESRCTFVQVRVLCRIKGVAAAQRPKAELCGDLAQFLNEFRNTFVFDNYLHGCLQRAADSPRIRR